MIQCCTNMYVKLEVLAIAETLYLALYTAVEIISIDKLLSLIIVIDFLVTVRNYACITVVSYFYTNARVLLP